MSLSSCVVRGGGAGDGHGCGVVLMLNREVDGGDGFSGGGGGGGDGGDGGLMAYGVRNGAGAMVEVTCLSADTYVNKYTYSHTPQHQHQH